jgi:hypothetical protein
MTNNFEKLVKQLCRANDYYQLQQIHAEIDLLANTIDISGYLNEVMKEQLNEKNWGCLCRLIFIVQRHPSSKYIPLLCNLLDNYREEVFMEAIVDALLIIEDKESVPSLIRALDYNLPGDESGHFNRKIVIALANIGTASAVEGIRNTLNHPKELAREEAEKCLQYFNNGK